MEAGTIAGVAVGCSVAFIFWVLGLISVLIETQQSKYCDSCAHTSHCGAACPFHEQFRENCRCTHPHHGAAPCPHTQRLPPTKRTKMVPKTISRPVMKMVSKWVPKSGTVDANGSAEFVEVKEPVPDLLLATVYEPVVEEVPGEMAGCYSDCKRCNCSACEPAPVSACTCSACGCAWCQLRGCRGCLGVVYSSLVRALQFLFICAQILVYYIIWFPLKYCFAHPTLCACSAFSPAVALVLCASLLDASAIAPWKFAAAAAAAFYLAGLLTAFSLQSNMEAPEGLLTSPFPHYLLAFTIAVLGSWWELDPRQPDDLGKHVLLGSAAYCVLTALCARSHHQLHSPLRSLHLLLVALCTLATVVWQLLDMPQIDGELRGEHAVFIAAICATVTASISGIALSLVIVWSRDSEHVALIGVAAHDEHDHYQS